MWLDTPEQAGHKFIQRVVGPAFQTPWATHDLGTLASHAARNRKTNVKVENRVVKNGKIEFLVDWEFDAESGQLLDDEGNVRKKRPRFAKKEVSVPVETV